MKISKTTTITITFTFPDGQSIDYKSDNVILEKLTKEYIIEKKLFPYILFYIARYEKNIVSGSDIGTAVNDLIYFREEIIRLHNQSELSDLEMTDLIGFIKTIITHITNGSENEERLVNIMGGVIIETESERLMRQGAAKVIVELGREDGFSDEAILNRFQKKIGVSPERAKAYLEQYGKQLL